MIGRHLLLACRGRFATWPRLNAGRGPGPVEAAIKGLVPVGMLILASLVLIYGAAWFWILQLPYPDTTVVTLTVAVALAILTLVVRADRLASHLQNLLDGEEIVPDVRALLAASARRPWSEGVRALRRVDHGTRDGGLALVSEVLDGGELSFGLEGGELSLDPGGGELSLDP